MNIYKINDKKFKGIYLSLNFLMQADKSVISSNSVLTSMISKDTKEYGNRRDIKRYMASLYGASFSANVEKYGDLENVEFRVECINPKLINEKEDIVDKCITFLKSMVFNTNINDIEFNNKLFEREKITILEKISARKDEKLKYGVNRMEEIMCNNTGFGTFLYGDEQVVRSLNKKDIIKAYDNLINNSVATFIVSGNLEGYLNIDEKIAEKFNMYNSKLGYKDLIYNIHQDVSNQENVYEKCDSTQSVMSVGIKIKDVDKEDMYALNVYNAILGSTPSSKLFQIFREKESLAYTARSRFYRFKDIIIIYAGIEAKNYEKGKEVILDILQSIKRLNITDEEFEAAKQSLIADLSEWNDSKIMMAKSLYTDLITYFKPTNSIEDMKLKINKISLNDVKDVANKMQLKVWYLLGGEENV